MSGALNSIELWLVALVATVTILTGFGIFSRWCSFSPAVPRRKLALLSVGMTMEQVRELLGRAREESHQNNGVTQWTYGARAKRHMLIVEFNANSAVIGFAHGVPEARRSRFSAKDS
jgi:outer membrane protein assembly factor BamE (lipoprotein component of BamABCDE complex)